MKNISRIVALLLVALMVAAFASCGESAPVSNMSSNSNSAPETSSIVETTAAPEASIVGSWKYTFVMDTLIDKQRDEILDEAEDDEKEMYEEIFKAFKGVPIDIVMTFTEDNKYTFEADEDSVKNATTTIKENLIKYIPKIIKALGYEYDEYFEIAETTEEELANNILESFDDDLLTPKSSSGIYSVEGDKLYTNENKSSYCGFELTNDTFTITDIVGNDLSFSEDKDVLLPMEFTRV